MGGIREVEVQGVIKDYGRSRALFGVSLRLHAGRATALLGDNGAGKSTLISILSTLSRPTRGRVLFDGHPAEELDPSALRGAIGVLSHEPRLYADLSARENLRFFCRLYGRFPAAAAEALLDRVGLRAAADRPVRTYSRGMVQRLALLRTLLPRPALLLLDEPYTGLDPGGVALLTELLAEERGRGAILLVTSHDLAALSPLCDHALVLRRGRLVAEASYGEGPPGAADLLALYHGKGAAA